jgi:hypothetical protein
MKIIVYADESGTHDRTFTQDGSHVPVVCGYTAYDSDWVKFCADWKTVLDNYDVPYFHYSELTHNKENTSIYYGWDENRRNNFLYDLAEIAGRQIPIGGNYHLEAHKALNKTDKKYPYSYVFEQFFKDLLVAIKEHNLIGDKSVEVEDDEGYLDGLAADDLFSGKINEAKESARFEKNKGVHGRFDLVADQITELGTNHWELVSALREQTDDLKLVLIFKRPVQ